MLQSLGLALGGLSSVVVLTGFPLLAQAKDGDVINEGNCSAASTWKLKASPENGKIEVEFEVDQNVRGQTWAVTLKRNGKIFFSGNKVTKGPSGSFAVRQVISNLPGDDSIVGKAKNLSTREVCLGSVVF
jgi:hypothetical protein